MLDLELLEELVAFQKYGTLSVTAEHLMITQPTVTRGMQKLEQELGVTLFDRSVSNRIALNDTGVLAANEAQKLLQAKDTFVEKVLNFNRLHHQVNIASVAPGPLHLIERLEELFPAKLVVNHQFVDTDKVIERLHNFAEQLIFTDQEIQTDDIESVYFGIEHINLGIDKFHPLAQRKKVTFKDLAGLKFLVVQKTGPWQKVIEEYIPQADFLYQKDINAIQILSHYSNFPFFYSNLTEEPHDQRFADGNHAKVIIDDPNDRVEFYGAYLKENRKLVQPLVKIITQNWPK